MPGWLTASDKRVDQLTFDMFRPYFIKLVSEMRTPKPIEGFRLSYLDAVNPALRALVMAICAARYDLKTIPRK
jgi:hypothetical protein